MGLWLAQVDCACRVAGIDDHAVKFDLVAANLPQSVVLQMRDVVTADGGGGDGRQSWQRVSLAPLQFCREHSRITLVNKNAPKPLTND